LSEFVLLVLGATAVVFVVLWVAARAMRAARRSSSSVGAFGWALLFLSSGRMPPPPPTSQIEVDISGKKSRESSRDYGNTEQ
jgi:hypothetical protein